MYTKRRKEDTFQYQQTVSLSFSDVHWEMHTLQSRHLDLFHQMINKCHTSGRSECPLTVALHQRHLQSCIRSTLPHVLSQTVHLALTGKLPSIH